jgi:enoyl-CoA hydratase
MVEAAPQITPPYETFTVEQEGPIDWVTLNRPDRLNAISRQMMWELQDYFQRLYTDHDVRVVIMRGAGRAFCAGLDLKESQGGGNSSKRGPAEGMRGQRQVSEIIMRMKRCPQPIISLIHGPASGGGFAFALASDVRIAGTSTRMNVAMARIGLTGCDVGISYFLPRAVGRSTAFELLMTGRFIDADRALRTGLVSDVVPDDELETTGRTLAEDMLFLSPLALRLTKEGAQMAADADSLEMAIAIEDRQQILCANGGDFREGVTAFMEKRKPVYTDD